MPGGQAVVSLATQSTQVSFMTDGLVSLKNVLNDLTMGPVVDRICHMDKLLVDSAILTKSPPSLLLAMARVKWV